MEPKAFMGQHRLSTNRHVSSGLLMVWLHGTSSDMEGAREETGTLEVPVQLREMTIGLHIHQPETQERDFGWKKASSGSWNPRKSERLGLSGKSVSGSPARRDSHAAWFLLAPSGLPLSPPLPSSLDYLILFLFLKTPQRHTPPAPSHREKAKFLQWLPGPFRTWSPWFLCTHFLVLAPPHHGGLAPVLQHPRPPSCLRISALWRPPPGPLCSARHPRVCSFTFP